MLQRLAIIILLGSGCADVRAAGVDMAEVERMEALWHSYAVTSYTFSPGILSLQPRRDPSVRITVVNSRVKDIRFLASFGKYKVGSRISASGLKKLAPFPLTIEEAFLRVRQCIEDKSSLDSVDFHRETGAPLSWTCGELAGDGWWGAELKDLETGTPPNKSLQRAGDP